jgi:dodecin
MTVVKVIELIGSSTTSWEDAVKSALSEAALTVQNIKEIYVKEY